ncbi:uncharacterized protein LOC114579901 [Dendrobium catenatum]|uniref:uncharacterized protein LOC114579901 n=1 Tax=Dendrobium catenatum TaxID=906689 RepID=UPI00109F6D57|nr:uncharacterized protein LOC114579901 [Dendrobium catenatum]
MLDWDSTREDSVRDELGKIMTDLLKEWGSHTRYLLERDRLLYQVRFVIPRTSIHIPNLLQEFHRSAVGGHSGVQKTYMRLVSKLYWKGMHRDVGEMAARWDSSEEEYPLPPIDECPNRSDQQEPRDLPEMLCVGDIQAMGQSVREIEETSTKSSTDYEEKADGHRKEIQFEVGERVFLKLPQPYRQKIVANRRNEKLVPRYFGPYEIMKKIGAAAYWLKLLPMMTVHPVFHVSQLRRAIEDYITSSELPVTLIDNLLVILKPLELMGVH